MIYFIEAIGLDLVKIGFTTDFATRFYDLQQMSPAPLRVVKTIASGTRKGEGALHRQLRDHLVRGEWFTYSAVRGVIDAISESTVPACHTCCDCGRPLRRNAPTRCRVCAGKRARERQTLERPWLARATCIDCGKLLGRKSKYSETVRCHSCGMRAAWTDPSYVASISAARASRRRKCLHCGKSEPRVKGKYHAACWEAAKGNRAESLKSGVG